eukprot:m.15651 g.15651  ORF g.15651 m.15651 type:complete len:338 (+) comp8566_c0_seq1:71-1084(+)
MDTQDSRAFEHRVNRSPCDAPMREDGDDDDGLELDDLPDARLAPRFSNESEKSFVEVKSLLFDEEDEQGDAGARFSGQSVTPEPPLQWRPTGNAPVLEITPTDFSFAAANTSATSPPSPTISSAAATESSAASTAGTSETEHEMWWDEAEDAGLLPLHTSHRKPADADNAGDTADGEDWVEIDTAACRRRKTSERDSQPPSISGRQRKPPLVIIVPDHTAAVSSSSGSFQGQRRPAVQPSSPALAATGELGAELDGDHGTGRRSSAQALVQLVRDFHTHSVWGQQLLVVPLCIIVLGALWLSGCGDAVLQRASPVLLGLCDVMFVTVAAFILVAFMG